MSGSEPVVLNIFDFDDTLVHQGATRVRVHTTHPGGSVTTRRVTLTKILSAREPIRENQVLDLQEFQEFPLITIEWSCRLLKYLAERTKSVQYLVILTARKDPLPVERFVKEIGVEEKVRVVALGAGSEPGYDKARWILEDVIDSANSGPGHYTKVCVYEDRMQTLQILEDTLTSPLRDLYGCKLSLIQVGAEHRRAHGLRRLVRPSEGT